MDQAQITALAHAIADQSIVNSWFFWAVFTGLVVVAGAGGAYIGSFFAKSGEIAALKGKQQQILDQLAATTRVAEETKSAVAFGEWNEKERRVLQRQKLEELILLAHKVFDYLRDEFNHVDDAVIVVRPSPQAAFRTIGVLHFPELVQTVRAFDLKSREWDLIIAETREAILDSRVGTTLLVASTAAVKVVAAAQGRISPLMTQLAELLRELEESAEALMRQIVEPPRK